MVPDGANQCPCITGFYDNTGRVCGSCHHSCLTCSGLLYTQCLTCPGLGSFRDDNSSTSQQCPCQTGYFDNMVSICVICSETCNTCNGPNSNQCLTCPDPVLT